MYERIKKISEFFNQEKDASKNLNPDLLKKFDIFKKWLINNGAIFKKNIDFPYVYGPFNLIGCKSISEIKENESILLIPKKLMIISKELKYLDKLTNDIKDKLYDMDDTSTINLTLHLYLENKNKHSFFRPYLDLLFSNYNYLKDLLFKLLAYKQNNRLKNIKEIFNEPWMKDMENYKEDDYKEYEKVMKTLEKEVSQDNETLENNPGKDNMTEEGGHNTKSSLDDNKTIYFDKNTKKNYLYKTGLNAMNYIKIKGKLNQEDFMNNLADKLIRIYQCKIIPHPEKLKFEVIFKNEKNEEIMEYREEEGEEEEEEENIEQFKYEDCGIKIKLFELIDGGYEIHFNRSQGSFMDYYKNFQNIKIIIKKILN